jgi:L-cystine uptake protein TcyP (sodium:dicarboxylate symporter family)
MGLNNWDILIEFKKDKKPDTDLATVAFTSTDSQYKQAILNYIPNREKYVDDKIIIHELLHVLFSPLVGYARGNLKKSEREWINYFNEQVVSELSTIIMRVKNGKTN